jgi:signal peptidase
MKIIKIVVNLLITAAVLVFCFIAAVSFFSAPESDGLFGLKGYVVISGSMEPSLSPGDFIMTRNSPYGNLEVGGVITFMGDNDIVTHRVEAITPEGLTTKGDANENPDASKVLEEDYIGSHLLTLPYFGHVIIFLQKPIAFILIAVALAGYFIMVYIRDGNEEEDKDKDKAAG